MKWFRLYHELLDDPKVQRLEPGLFKFWINFLCLANRSEERGVVTLEPEAIAFALRISDDEARDALDTLARLGLIDPVETGLKPHNWDDRQRKSDDVTARVTAHRNARNTNETLHETLHATSAKQSGNVTSSARTRAPEKELETREEENGGFSPEPPARVRARAQNDPDGFAEFWTAYPKRTNRKSAVDQWRRLKPDAALQAVIMAAIAAQQTGRQWLDGYVPEAARWLRDRRWTDEIESPRPLTPPPIIPPDPVAARRRKLDRLKRGDFEGYTENQTYRGFDGDVRLAADIAKLERELAQGAQA